MSTPVEQIDDTETRLSQADLRHAFSLYPTGVVAVCALAGGRPNGIAINSFSSISLDPPLVSISIANSSATWPKLKSAPRLGLSVLGAHQNDLCRQLSSKKTDRFDGVDWQATEAGAVLLAGAALWLECRPFRVFEGGDHMVELLEITRCEVFADVPPLVFHLSQFRDLAPF